MTWDYDAWRKDYIKVDQWMVKTEEVQDDIVFDRGSKREHRLVLVKKGKLGDTVRKPNATIFWLGDLVYDEVNRVGIETFELRSGQFTLEYPL